MTSLTPVTGRPAAWILYVVATKPRVSRAWSPVGLECQPLASSSTTWNQCPRTWRRQYAPSHVTSAVTSHVASWSSALARDVHNIVNLACDVNHQCLSVWHHQTIPCPCVTSTVSSHALSSTARWICVKRRRHLKNTFVVNADGYF